MTITFIMTTTKVVLQNTARALQYRGNAQKLDWFLRMRCCCGVGLTKVNSGRQPGTGPCTKDIFFLATAFSCSNRPGIAAQEELGLGTVFCHRGVYIHRLLVAVTGGSSTFSTGPPCCVSGHGCAFYISIPNDSEITFSSSTECMINLEGILPLLKFF